MSASEKFNVMNNASNSFRLIIVFGFILVLLGLFYLPYRIEKILIHRAELVNELEIYEANGRFQLEDHQLIKKQMNELNDIVSRINDQITGLINHTAFLNDSINQLMTRVVNEPRLLDTIQDLYTSGILADEIKIDSLNLLFEERSNRLIGKIKTFNEKDRDLKITQSGVRSKEFKIRYIKMSLLVHLAVWVIALLGGGIMFINGFIRWRGDRSGA
jgi:hypothetical protein